MTHPLGDPDCAAARNAEPLRVAFVGAGFVGQVAHLANFATLPDCRVVALAETRPHLRDAVADHYAIPRRYPSHRELLEDLHGANDVDAVVAILPRPLTPVVAEEVLRAGKPLLTEKPMAATVAQGERLVAAAEATGVPHAVGYMRRHDAGIIWARDRIAELLQSGELGSITAVRSSCYQGNDYCSIDGAIETAEPRPSHTEDPAWPVAPEWIPNDRKAEYASFWNVYCHNLNLIRFLVGEPERIEMARFAQGFGHVVFEHRGGERGFRTLLEIGSVASSGWHELTEVWFERGRVTITPPPAFLRNVSARVEVLTCGPDGDQVTTQEPEWSWAFRRQAGAFVRDVRDRQPPIASSRDALSDLRWVEEIWRCELNQQDTGVPS